LHIGLDSVIKEQNYAGAISYQNIKNTSMEEVRGSVGYQLRYNIYYRGLINT